MKPSVQGVFSKNRAEELDGDVWERFVIPPFFKRLDLTTARKPRVVIGGRGCGKTMLLRYLSHQTTFSRLRTCIPADELLHIGLYWRADTQFMNLMYGRGISEDRWSSAFVHFVSIALGYEILASIESMATSSLETINEQQLKNLDFTRLQVFSTSCPMDMPGMMRYLQSQLWVMQTWANDIKVDEPRFLPGVPFLKALISELKRQIPDLAPANFFVYIDEYENLRPYQQLIINTWLKHSQAPLIFNLAMKRNAFETKTTTGPESLSNIHDYRVHDLELELGSDFPLFAAEILFLQLSLVGQHVPIDAAMLRDPNRLREREEKPYSDLVRTAADVIFPAYTQAEMASLVFSTSIRNKLVDRLRQALRHRQSALDPADFMDAANAEASVVTPALLYRTSLSPDYVLEQFRKVQHSEANDFTGSKDWTHNNFVGAYLQLFEPHARPCPVYAGFQAFCQLSHGNVRHFLELCHQSISRVDEWEMGVPVPIEVQAEAARLASTSFLREVKACGPHGLQLYNFVMRLGSVFALAHQRPTQSEPEQTHFTLVEGLNQISPEDHKFIKEAVKWSVLYEEQETKSKATTDLEDMDYILDPIYAPYFHISYRKRRSIRIKTSDLVILIRGTYDDLKTLLKRYSTQWNVEPKELPPTLFSHLERD